MTGLQFCVARPYTVTQDEYGVRMYEPEYGRFMSVDPMWAATGHFTPYSYASNSPIGASDRSGLSEFIDKQ